MAATVTMVPVWEWQADGTHWTPFHHADSGTIEAAYQKVGTSRPYETKDLSWNRGFSTLYRYDFSLMKQTNTDSGRVRLLRRTEAPGCPEGHAMTKRQPRSADGAQCSACKRAPSGTPEWHYCERCRCWRCAGCSGQEVTLRKLSTPAEWIETFRLLSREQVQALRHDTACSAMLKRDNLQVVWRSWSDVGRTFGEETGQNTTTVSFFAIAPESRGDQSKFVPFPAVRAPNYLDPVDVLPCADALKFTARTLQGSMQSVTLKEFLARIGEFIAGISSSQRWDDPIDDTPMQQSTQFSVIPVPSGKTDVGVAAVGAQATNLHVIVGPGGEVGWAPEKPGVQRIFFRSGDGGKELRAISLVPEDRQEVTRAFFKVEVKDETVEEERKRYEKTENRLLHLQIAMDGVKAAPQPGGQPARQSNCPVGHGLVRFTVRSGAAFICDQCERHLSAGSAAYGCRLCDFDVCPKCWGLGEGPRPAAAADAAPAAGYEVPAWTTVLGAKPKQSAKEHSGQRGRGGYRPPPGCCGSSTPARMGPVQSAVYGRPGKGAGGKGGGKGAAAAPSWTTPPVSCWAPPPSRSPGAPPGNPHGFAGAPTACLDYELLMVPKKASAAAPPSCGRAAGRGAALSAMSARGRGGRTAAAPCQGPPVQAAPTCERRPTSSPQRARLRWDEEDMLAGAAQCAAEGPCDDEDERCSSGSEQGAVVAAGLQLARVAEGGVVAAAESDDQIPAGATRKAGVAVRATWLHYGVAADGKVDAERVRRFAKQIAFRRRELGLPHGSLVSGIGSWGGPENCPIKLFGFRLTDANENPRCQLCEIRGVLDQPLPKTLPDACSPIEKVVSGVTAAAKQASVAAKALHKLSKGKVGTPEHVAALYLYTMEHQFYRSLNAAMRDSDRSQAGPYFSYLRLLFDALAKVEAELGESKPKTLHRGVNLDLSADHPLGQDVYWWGASSCTTSKSVALGFLGCSGKRTLFHVTPLSAVPIRDFSAFRGEEEWLLRPGTRLRVDKVQTQTGGLTEVHLTELPPPRGIE